MRVLVMSLIACWAGIAQAEQYWVSYDADDGRFPEECGWTRYTHGGGSVRSLSDGILTLDSMGDTMISDCYEITRSTTPDAGETYVAEWRMCVAQQSGYWESLVALAGDSGQVVRFDYRANALKSGREGWTIPIAPGVYHTYRLESSDAAVYSFWIDGTYVQTGRFVGPGPSIPFVNFGDGSYGTEPGVSLTQWDYFRFGIVPEPNSLTLVLALLTCACVTRGSRR